MLWYVQFVLFLAEQYSNHWIYHSFLLYSPVVGTSGCFEILSITNKVGTVTFNSFLYYLVTPLFSFRSTSVLGYGLVTGKAGDLHTSLFIFV